MTLDISNARIAVIGLGYVGLPLLVAFGKKYPCVGFDIQENRIRQLREGIDKTNEMTSEELAAVDVTYTAEPSDLKDCNVFIVTVPTPIDQQNRPDLTPLQSASKLVGSALNDGDVVIYESTVYPGATEEVCVPILEQVSGLQFNQQFFAGYSPERINPGDKQHRIETIVKVTSGSTPEVTSYVDQLYSSIIEAGTHNVTSIKVAEAAKVISGQESALA